MRDAFISKNLQARFDHDGYVVVPFLTQEQVAGLERAYHDLKHESDLETASHVTIHSRNPEFRRKVSDTIRAVIDAKEHKLLDRYRMVFSNFSVKEPRSEESAFDLHIDWSMVDEEQSVSVSIWIPLTDITADNGYLWVLKGSHRLGRTWRGGPGFLSYSEQKFPEDNLPLFDKEAVKLKAGEALIYDQRLIHGSTANISDEIRIAVSSVWVPEECQTLFHYFNEKKSRETFLVDDDFFFTHDVRQKPVGVQSLSRADVQPSHFLTKWDLNGMCTD